MHKGEVQIDQALADLVALRQTITAFEVKKQGVIASGSYRANLILQKVSGGLALLFLLVELLGNNIIARTMVEKNPDLFYRVLGISIIGAFLAACLFFISRTVTASAQLSGEDADLFIRRNFKYLQRLSHYTDLIVKFVIFAFLIAGQKPEWVSAFLLLFTADYLFQGRLFTFSTRAAFGLAFATLIFAGVEFYLGEARVLWPLLWFVVVTLLSIKNLRSLKRVEDFER